MVRIEEGSLKKFNRIMKNIFTLLFILTSYKGVCQKSLEVSLFLRYDNYGEYTSRFFENAATTDITLAGKSQGINISYVQPLLEKIKVKVGVGYYKLGMNDVTSTNLGFIPPTRPIDYSHPDGIQPLFSTGKYHYNNLNLVSGISFENNLFKSVIIKVGADINFRYSYSQKYYLNYNDIKYKSSNGKPYGFGVDSYLGLLKSIASNKYYINPNFILPLFQRIKGDKVFTEDEKMRIDKKFSGYGVALTIGKYL